eukprot:gene19644-21586_t
MDGSKEYIESDGNEDTEPAVDLQKTLLTRQNQLDISTDGLPTGHVNPTGNAQPTGSENLGKKRKGPAISTHTISKAPCSNIDDDCVSVHADAEDDFSNDEYEPDELLQQLSNELESTEKTGTAVNQQLADIVSKRWGKQLPQEKSKLFSTDARLSNVQQTTQRVGCIAVNAANYFLQSDHNDNPVNPSDILTSLVDGMALLGHATADLSTLRRNSLRTAVKPEYKTLTSRDIAHSALLFGSDFTKELKEAEETSKVSKAFHSLRPNDNRNRTRSNFAAPYQSQNGRRNSFLFRGRHRPPFRSKRGFYQRPPQSQQQSAPQNQRNPNTKKF